MRLGIYFGIHLDHFSALVEAAVLADSVGNSQCAAVGALAERRSADLPDIGSSLVLSCFGRLSLRYCHDGASSNQNKWFNLHFRQGA
mgnify:FL=1